MALSEMIAHRTNKSISYFFHCYYRPQRSWAKVIFLQASVCPQGGKGCLPQCMLGHNPPGPGRHPHGPDPPRADTPQSRHPPDQTPLPLDQADTPRSRHPPRAEHALDHTPREADFSIRSTSGQYASYWNAFLFCS